LFISAICQYGQNLSGDYLHVNTLTSSIAGVQSERLDQFWYQQGLLHDLLKIKVGQVVAVDEFGATGFFDILFNDELGYAPNPIFTAKQPFSPAGKPGAIVWGDLSVITPGLYVKAGIFAAYDNPYNPDGWGVDYHDQFDHGYAGSFELGYQEQNTLYAGVYKLGINGNNLAVYENLDTGKPLRGDFNAYGLVQKTVYHPRDADGKLDTKKGLDLLLEGVGQPDDRNLLAYEILAGARYTGLIPGRDQDKIGVGFIYSENSSAASEAYNAINGHGLGGETTVEFDYQFNPTPWFTLQLDNQFIIDPGGDDTRSTITVIGLRTIFRF
jgi:porin